MKKSLLAVIAISVTLLLPLVSCSTYYQICKVSSDLPTSSLGAYEYRGEYCDITYNFYSNRGKFVFKIFNKTDEILYVDLTKSFFIKDNIAYDYFIKSASPNGYSSEILLDGIVLGSSIVPPVTAKPIILIPPHSSKIFTKYSIEDPYADFKNCISVSVGDNGEKRLINNSFSVSKRIDTKEFPPYSPKNFWLLKEGTYPEEAQNIIETEEDSTELLTQSDSLTELNSEDADARELVYGQLKEINKSLKEGNADIADIKNKVKRIDKWYNSISYEYPEVEKLLREIKRRI